MSSCHYVIMSLCHYVIMALCHFVIIRETPNIDVNELASLLVDKIGFPGVKRTEAIEVDIQKEISIGKVDKNAVKSEVTVGPVNNRVDKLRELRRNGS